MRILVVTPARRGSIQGNRVTATRWAKILRSLGHKVEIANVFDEQSCDLLIALHARKSAPSIFEYRKSRPNSPVVLCLTGTDVYQDLKTSRDAQRAIEFVDRIVTLQPLAANELPFALRSKVQTIYQSAGRPKSRPKALRSSFEISVLGHLREVKDPFRAAEAARMLPADSRIRITHLGGALSKEFADTARKEMNQNSRYRWLGERPRAFAKKVLARSRAMVISSRLEGGANVVSESIVCGVPVLASFIPGNVGLLGEKYPGYFEVGNTEELAALMMQIENDYDYFRELRRLCTERQGIFSVKKEMDSWVKLLMDLA